MSNLFSIQPSAHRASAFVFAAMRHDVPLCTTVSFSGDSSKDILDCKRTRGSLEIQLKCSCTVERSQDDISFALPVKNYNELRAEVIVPRLLVLVCVPEDCDDWTRQTEEQLCLYHCAYWLSLAGKPETANVTTVTVHIPRSNVFSVDFLREAMRHSANGEAL